VVGKITDVILLRALLAFHYWGSKKLEERIRVVYPKSAPAPINAKKPGAKWHPASATGR